MRKNITDAYRRLKIGDPTLSAEEDYREDVKKLAQKGIDVLHLPRVCVRP